MTEEQKIFKRYKNETIKLTESYSGGVSQFLSDIYTCKSMKVDGKILSR